MLHRLAVVGAMSFLLVLFAQSAWADGIVIPDPIEPIPPDGVVYPFLPIKYHRVEVEIDDQVAQVKVDQAFLNESDQPLEATYIFPLPEDATISDFALYVEGERLEGRILDKEKARAIYEEIVRHRRDPALLEYVGRNTFQAQVFPIPPHGERRIQIAYTQVLTQDSGLVHFVYPLNTEKFSPRPLEEVTISVEVSSKSPIKAVYSPSHDVAISRQDERHVSVSYEANDVTPSTDFELFYSLSPDDFGLNLVTYRQGDDDGFFLLLVAPKADFSQREVVAKDVMLVVDISGSMAGEKLEQAQEAANFILDHLNPDDRFNILAFSTSVDLYAETLQGAGQADDARSFVRRLAASGGTNINEALLTALAALPGERPELLIFLTDGQPTVGVKEAGEIVANVQEAAAPTVRLFAFGLGDDVNTLLLDSVAQENHGLSQYVRPGEDIAEAVSAFYEKVSTPVLADISLDFGAIDVSDVYPQPLPDLFAGSQLVMVGRYRDEGSETLRLSGTVNGRTQSFSYPDQVFPSRATEMDFLPRLWATRKIGYLLNQVRLHGSERELIDEIVELSLRYGVMTPYPSFLVEEDVPIFSSEGRKEATSDLERALPGSLAPATGAGAVENAQAIQSYSQAEAAAGSPSVGMKVVGDKTFVQRDDVWIDTSYEEDMSTTRFGFGSDDYYRVLGERPDWGPYFALGERVIFLADGQAYEITEGDYPPVDVPASSSADENPAPVSPTSGDGSGDQLVIMLATLGAVGAAAGGLVLWSWRRRGAKRSG